MNDDSNGRRAAVLAGALVLLFAVSIVRFAVFQDVWTDESTQLSGMKLGPVELLGWLAGDSPDRFGLPDDRSPPGSYLLDWLWNMAIPDSIVSLRLFHGFLVVFGVAVLVVAAIRHLGVKTGFVLAVLFLLSTRVIQAAVEIRAYPLFLALTCLLLALQIRILTSPGSVGVRTMAAHTVTGVLLVWTHFFGAVAYFSLIAGLLWHYRRDRRSLLLAVIAAGVVLLCMGALAPIILASKDITDGVAYSVGAASLARYAGQLLVSSAELVWIPGAAALALGSVSLLLAACYQGFFGSARASSTDNTWISATVVALATGVATTITAALLIEGFNPLKITYSLWTTPLILLLIAGTWNQAKGSSWWRRFGRHCALAFVICGMGLATASQTMRPDLFIHGPRRFLLQQLEAAGGSAVPIVYDTVDNWPFGYFPVHYSGKGKIPQWVAADPSGKMLARITPGRMADPIPLPQALQGSDKVLVAVIEPKNSGDLRRYLMGATPEMSMGPVGQLLTQSADWMLENARAMPGYNDTRVWIWRRVPQPAR